VVGGASTTTAQGVRLVVAFTKAGGTLRLLVGKENKTLVIGNRSHTKKMLNKINSPLNFRPLRVRQVEDFAKFAIFNSRSQLTHRFLHKITRDGSEIRRFYFGLTWIFYAPSCVANG